MIMVAGLGVLDLSQSDQLLPRDHSLHFGQQQLLSCPLLGRGLIVVREIGLPFALNPILISVQAINFPWRGQGFPESL